VFNELIDVFIGQGFLCHPECREGSVAIGSEMLRYAQQNAICYSPAQQPTIM